MKRIEIKLSLPVVAPLLDVIKRASESLSSDLAAPLVMREIDEDFKDAWKTDLLNSQTADLRVMLALFDENFFAEGVIALDGTNSEPVVRACAAVRLRLRERYLKDLADDVLESSEVEIAELEEPLRKAFMCYLFLATLQELIIQHLDPSLTE